MLSNKSLKEISKAERIDSVTSGVSKRRRPVGSHVVRPHPDPTAPSPDAPAPGIVAPSETLPSINYEPTVKRDRILTSKITS